MSYIGVQPTAGQYRKLDNISSGFNGSTTSFTTSVSGTNVTAGTAQQLLVSLGGVIQQPDTDYTVSTNTITFTTAPTSGLSFFAVLMGDALNTVSVSDGAITTAKLAGNLSVGLAAGTAAAPSLYFTGDTNTGIYSPGANEVAISTDGTARAVIDSSGRLLVGTSSTSSISSLVVEGASGTTNHGIIYLARDNAPPSSTSLLGQFNFSDNGHTPAAAIECRRDSGTWTSGSSQPTSLLFNTTADGASSPTERMRITSDGYFKASNNSTYSTASPDYHQFNQSAASQWALGVFNRHASQPFGVTIQYLNATPNGTTNSFLLCGDATADRVQLRSNGGIANYSANNVNLSDINTKKDISLAAGTWDCLKEWEIVNFRYKDQPDDADLNMGVIAQQVAESCPEVITVFEEAKEDQPEKLGIKEQQMYWMAIKALQEAQVRIEALEAEVAALKAQ